MKKSKILPLLIILGVIMGCNSPNSQKRSLATNEYQMDRTVLPIQPPLHEPVTILDARDAEKPASAFKVTAPEGAPNIVVVLIDDIGFSASSTFGGAIHTPTFDKLADNGLRFNRFHTTALCSPTRASLLSGRNHHNVNVGSVMEIATGFFGNQGIRPDNAKYFAEALKYNVLENGMKPLPGKFQCPDRTIAGQPIQGLINSMVLLVEKPINGIP
jgi:arylsulfatase